MSLNSSELVMRLDYQILLKSSPTKLTDCIRPCFKPNDNEHWPVTTQADNESQEFLLTLLVV